MMKHYAFLSLLPCLAIATCTANQIDASVSAACSAKDQAYAATQQTLTDVGADSQAQKDAKRAYAYATLACTAATATAAGYAAATKAQ